MSGGRATCQCEDGTVQWAGGELVELGGRALPDFSPDLDGLRDLLAIGPVLQRLADVVLQARLAVGGDGGSNGDQL
jgi:hypothetical protein